MMCFTGAKGVIVLYLNSKTFAFSIIIFLCIMKCLKISHRLFIFLFVQDYVALRGEVYFPNLEFEKSVVDFGCILNDTEVTRYINITNNSPMEVILSL